MRFGVRLGRVKDGEGEEWHVTKQEFVERVAAKTNLTKADAGRAVDAFLESVTEVLTSGGAADFAGFGKFSTQGRKARTGVTPRTGAKVYIAAATVPKFTAGS